MNVRIEGITVNDAGKPTFEAFGELKTLDEWLRDRRCAVAKATLYKRIFCGWTLEKSMSLPLGASPRASDGRLQLRIVHGSRRSPKRSFRAA